MERKSEILGRNLDRRAWCSGNLAIGARRDGMLLEEKNKIALKKNGRRDEFIPH